MRGKRKRARGKGSRRRRHAARKKPRATRTHRGAAARAKAKGARQLAAAGREPLLAYVDAAARLLDLAIASEWREEIAANLAAILRLSASFMEFPLPDDAEPAPTFKA